MTDTRYLTQRLGVVLAVCVLGAGAAQCATWPTYLHDNGRSAVSPVGLPLPLTCTWVFKPAHKPIPGWGNPPKEPVEGNLELPRLRFDDAYHVTCAYGLVYFGSSAENKIVALRADTGGIVWEFLTDGPVRLAPTVWEEKIYAGSDDGVVYCLDAHTGTLLWRFKAAPAGDLVLGHGRLISLWPVRTGVVVSEGVAYFGAGVFPAEGLCLYAADARTGKLLWKNDTYGNGGTGTVSPQGYLIVSEDKIFVPSGRAMPAAFDKRTGRFLFHRNFSWRAIGLFGGTYALLAGDLLLTGTEQILGVRQKDGGLVFTYPARRVVLSPDTVYLLTGKECIAYRRKRWTDIVTGIQSLKLQVRNQRRRVNSLREQVRRNKSLAKRLQNEIQLLNRLQADFKTAEAELKNSARWRRPCTLTDSLILAGKTLFAGGPGRVVAFDAESGRTVWTGEVEGTARGLAVAEAKLFISTDTGSIYCFGSQEGGRTITIEPEKVPNPFPPSDSSGFYRKTAERILNAAGQDRGFCLLAGGSGPLAYELARHSKLRVYLCTEDIELARRLRKVFNSAAFYGERLGILQGKARDLKLPPYFANLLIFAADLAPVELPNPRLVFKLLKPCGGAAFIGRAPGDPAGPLSRELLENYVEKYRDFLKARGETETEVRLENSWIIIKRGRLPGAGSWTHQYADPGNTAASNDRLVRGNLGVSWFGDPGPAEMPNRHASAAAPLAVNGRLYVQGVNLIMAYDAYNGVQLWKRRIQGALRTHLKVECSNLAADDRFLYVAVGSRCLKLDGLTGRTVHTFNVPVHPKSPSGSWGYVARVGRFLLGSSTKGSHTSDRLFAYDAESGSLKWQYVGKAIMNTTICSDGKRIYFVDRSVTPEQRAQALEGIEHSMRVDRRGKPIPPDVRLVVALNLTTGGVLWEKPQYVSDCVKIGSGGGDLTAMCAEGVLLLCAQPWNGHFWSEFFAGAFSRRSLIAIDGENGKLLWSGRKGYRSRPLIVGDTIIAEPWAYDLRTGEPKQRENPVTGRYEKWQMSRPGHHCGCIAGSTNVLFFRSGSAALYDLQGDYGTAHFGGLRSGCWINCIPANGIVTMPEASSGCVCPFALQCTVAFGPRGRSRWWGMYSASGPLLPVTHMAINFGAPGDRRGSDGTLWLTYPRPRTDRLVLNVPVTVELWPGGRYQAEGVDFPEIQGAPDPWLFASRVEGVRRIRIPCTSPGDPPGLYTVKLYFLEPKLQLPGRRVFSVEIQNRVVEDKLDIAAETGAKGAPLVKQYDDFVVQGDIEIAFSPRGELNGAAPPVLCAVELIRKAVLPLSVGIRPAMMSEFRRSVTSTAVLKNHTIEDLEGELRVETPPGFEASVDPANVTIPSKAALQVSVTLRAKPGVRAGRYPAAVVLRDTKGRELRLPFMIRHTGSAGELVIPASADAFVQKRTPDEPHGAKPYLLVDGGAQKMQDGDYAVVYLRFDVDVPGKVKSVKLRLYVSDSTAAQSNDSGRIHLVQAPWHEKTVTFNSRPALGRQVGVIGRVPRGKPVERPISVNLDKPGRLSLALVPTTTDGAIYLSREGGKAPELVISYGP